jgi:hypothetical protein
LDKLNRKLEEVYPDLTFRAVDYRIFVEVRPESEGSLVEKAGFVNAKIPPPDDYRRLQF